MILNVNGGLLGPEPDQVVAEHRSGSWLAAEWCWKASRSLARVEDVCLQKYTRLGEVTPVKVHRIYSTRVESIGKKVGGQRLAAKRQSCSKTSQGREKQTFRTRRPNTTTCYQPRTSKAPRVAQTALDGQDKTPSSYLSDKFKPDELGHVRTDQPLGSRTSRGTPSKSWKVDLITGTISINWTLCIARGPGQEMQGTGGLTDGWGATGSGALGRDGVLSDEMKFIRHATKVGNNSSVDQATADSNSRRRSRRRVRSMNSRVPS